MIFAIATDHLVETERLSNVLNKFSSAREELRISKSAGLLFTAHVVETNPTYSVLYRISTNVLKQTGLEFAVTPLLRRPVLCA